MNLWRSAYESLKIISEPVCRVIIEIDWQYDISRDWKLKALFEQFNLSWTVCKTIFIRAGWMNPKRVNLRLHDVSILLKDLLKELEWLPWNLNIKMHYFIIKPINQHVPWKWNCIPQWIRNINTLTSNRLHLRFIKWRGLSNLSVISSFFDR